MKKPVRELHSPMPPEPIGEVELSLLILTMKGFNILSEVGNKLHAVRFTGPPYNPSDQQCRSVEIISHQRGRTVSGFHVDHLLRVFGIAEVDFRDGYATAKETDRRKVVEFPKKTETE